MAIVKPESYLAGWAAAVGQGCAGGGLIPIVRKAVPVRGVILPRAVRGCERGRAVQRVLARRHARCHRPCMRKMHLLATQPPDACPTVPLSVFDGRASVILLASLDSPVNSVAGLRSQLHQGRRISWVGLPSADPKRIVFF